MTQGRTRLAGTVVAMVLLALSLTAHATETYGLTPSIGSTLFASSSPHAVTIDNAITVTDSDSTGLSGATVSIESGFVSAEDLLEHRTG